MNRISLDNTLQRSLLLGWVLALAACGGGGSADTPAPAAPNAAPAPAPAPAPDPAPASPPVAPAPGPTVAGSRATCALADFQAEALRLINAHRAAGASCGARGSYAATTALRWNDALTQAALVHSDDMVAHNFFSHTGSDGRSAGDRATAAGYVWRTWGENIAAGQPTVNTVVAAWMASDGHCANLMNPAFRDIGLACVAGGSSNRYRTYWTQVLGAAP
jgi:uncharacterized protein YkwD